MPFPLVNYAFNSDLTGWTSTGNPATLEWVDGKAHLIAGVTIGGIYQVVAGLQAGAEVTITARLTDVAVNDFWIRLSQGGTNLNGHEQNTPGMYTETYVLPLSGSWSVILLQGIGGEVSIDYVIGVTNMAGFFTTQMQDRDDDMRQFTLPTTQVSAANHDAQYALAQALVAAVEGISRLTTKQWDFGARRTETGDPKPTAGSAQVNIEWQVTYVEDTTLEVRTVRIGGANLDIADILLSGSNVADLSETTMAAFVTAFEAYVVGPNGNAVTVSQVAFLE